MIEENSERPLRSHSRSSESKAQTFDSTVISSREDRVVRVDPMIMMKQGMAQLQEQNARLRAELALKTVEHARQLQDLNAARVQQLADRMAALSAQNLNLNSLLQVLQGELYAVKECIRSKQDDIRRLQRRDQQHLLKQAQLEQSKEQLLCLFKRFESREVYQAVRDLNCCQELICSNVKSLVQAEERAQEELRGQHQAEYRSYLRAIRQAQLASEEADLLKGIDNEIEQFRKTVLLSTNKHFRTRTHLLQSMAIGPDDEDCVLDDTSNIYKRRIRRLKAIVIRLLNNLQLIPQLRQQLSKMSKQLTDFHSSLNQHYSEMFQRAIESIHRRLANSNRPPSPPKPAKRKKQPSLSHRQ